MSCYHCGANLNSNPDYTWIRLSDIYNQFEDGERTTYKIRFCKKCPRPNCDTCKRPLGSFDILSKFNQEYGSRDNHPHTFTCNGCFHK